jgi:hypothetical protein
MLVEGEYKTLFLSKSGSGSILYMYGMLVV